MSTYAAILVLPRNNFHEHLNFESYLYRRQEAILLPKKYASLIVCLLGATRTWVTTSYSVGKNSKQSTRAQR